MPVKYLAHDKKGNGHLPYTDDAGKIDTRRIGAAWAALHGGYRGQKYSGPGKANAVKKLRSLYKSMGRKPPNEQALFVGNFTEVLEARKSYFVESGYALTEATALARLALAKPMSSRVYEKSAEWLAEWLPAAQAMLESQYEELARKVTAYADKNPTLFADKDDAPGTSFQIQGVYPAIGVNPAIVIAHDLLSDGEYYAADWQETADGDIEFSNVRDISVQYEMLAVRLQNNLSEALIMVMESLENSFLAESEYLASRVLGAAVTLPELYLDGPRPVAEIELVKFYERQGLLTEYHGSTMSLLPEVKFTGEISSKDAVIQLAEAMVRSRATRKRAARAQARLIHPTLGQPMKVGGVKEQDLFGSLIFDKKIYDAQSAKNWAKLNDFAHGNVVEGTEDIRVSQSACPCKKGTLRVVPISRGVSGTVCARG